jgi:hypothetical protein
VPFASNFELSVPVLDPATAEESSERVLVTSAEISKTDSNEVVLRVARLVAQGSTLRIAGRAFVEGSKGEIKSDIESDVGVVQALFASVAFQSGRAELVTAGPAPEAKAEDRDAAAMRKQLEAHLDKRGVSADEKKATLDRYDAIPEEVIPSPKLRAALAALNGTFAADAYDSLLTAGNCTNARAANVLFQPPPGAPQLLARVTYTRDGRRIISFNPSLEGERFELLMPLIAHESIHCDRADGRFEEISATALDTFLYLFLVANDPGIAATGSPLAKELNVDAIALINSGRRVPESVGVLRSPAVQRVLPGTSLPYTSFAEFIATTYSDITENQSPQEALAQAYVAQIAGASNQQPGSAFDLAYLDELLGKAINPEVLVAVVRALSLAPAS